METSREAILSVDGEDIVGNDVEEYERPTDDRKAKKTEKSDELLRKTLKSADEAVVAHKRCNDILQAQTGVSLFIYMTDKAVKNACEHN